MLSDSLAQVGGAANREQDRRLKPLDAEWRIGDSPRSLDVNVVWQARPIINAVPRDPVESRRLGSVLDLKRFALSRLQNQSLCSPFQSNPCRSNVECRQCVHSSLCGAGLLVALRDVPGTCVVSLCEAEVLRVDNRFIASPAP